MALPVQGSSLFRIGWGDIYNDEVLEQLVTLFRENIEAVDEVAFFIGYVHDYLPVSEQHKQIARIRIAMKRLQELGITCGINVLTTLGHLDEQGPVMPPMDVPPMVGPDGTTAMCQACPRSPELLAQTTERYREVALEKPAFVWVDDDVRMAHHRPVDYSCFCDICLNDFAQITGLPADREAIVAALSEETWPQENKIRRAWLEFLHDTVARLMRQVEQAVHSVDPTIELGFMGSDMAFRGYSAGPLSGIMEALASEQMPKVRLRPGGGAYTDFGPMEFVRKAFSVSQQTGAARGNNLGANQSEVESFPYQRTCKSTHMTIFEASCYIAAGCDGTAFNVLGGFTEPIPEYAPLVERIAQMRPFWRELASSMENLPSVGAWAATSQYGEAQRPLADQRWPNGGNQGHYYRIAGLNDMGLPLAENQVASQLTVLSGDQVVEFSKDELIEILSGPVLLDGEGLGWLEALGLGHLTGVKRGRKLSGFILQQYTDHPLNGQWAGECRDARITFFPDGASWELDPLAEVEVLGRVFSTDEGPQGPGMVAYENELGGRVVTFGYTLWLNNLLRAARYATNMATAWATRGTIPCQVIQPGRVVPYVRTAGDKLAIALANASFEDLTEVTLLWSWPTLPAQVMGMDGKWQPINSSDIFDITTPDFSEALGAKVCQPRILTIQLNLPAWNMVVIKP